MADASASSRDEKRILEICSAGVSDFSKDELLQLIDIPGVRVDATDENGMTGLMHAAYKGNMDACNMLLGSGADVNSNLHSEGYTALMFATIAGHVNAVNLFLRAGAKISTTTNAGKTAAQLGAFVGQHACVHVINNYFSLEDLRYYTAPRGVEKAPKLDPSLASPLHVLMVTSNLHPVKIVFHLRSNPSLLDLHDQVTRILRILTDQMMEKGRDGYSLKLHYIAFVVQQCHRIDGGTSGCLKMLLTLQEDGTATELDKFLRQCLREFPHPRSALLQQMVATLAKVPAGGDPTALSMFYSVILGNKSEEEQESCSTCGEFSSCLKKCSKCKQARYCDVECQRLAWTVGNHKKLCRRWARKQQEEQPPTLRDGDEPLKKEKDTSVGTQQPQEGGSSQVGVAEVPTA